MTHKQILGLGFISGLLTLALAIRAGIDLPRWIIGIPFVYFFSGYPLSLLLVPTADSLLTRLLVSSGLSLFLTYPAGFINVLREGQTGQAIFGYHLSGDIVSLLVVYLFFVLLLKIRRFDLRVKAEYQLYPYWLLFISVVVSVFMNFYQLGYPDLNGDEYDMGYQAYNLADGIFAGRKAYALSFSAHPPLPMYIQHYTMNILSPHGLDSLSDGMYRVGPAIVGVLVVVLVYLLALETTRQKSVAFLSAIMLSVNNYHVFLSRIFHREMFLTFFMFLSLYMLLKYLHHQKGSYLFVAGIFTGGVLLIKAAGLVLIPVMVLMLLVCFRRNWLRRLSIFLGVTVLIFLPVILYNIGAFIMTGHTDILFSKIFHTPTHPSARVVNPSVVANLKDMFSVLLDQYGLLLSIAFLGGLIFSFKNHKQSFNWLWLSLVAVTGLFFTVTVVRPYYFPFLTVPLVIMMGTLLTVVTRKSDLLGKGVIIALFVYSLVYTTKTEFDRAFVVSEKYTENYPTMADLLTSDYSKTTRGWLESRGWKMLSVNVAQNYRDGTCLMINIDDHPMQLRRYLGIADEVKGFYLGSDKKDRYKVCDSASYLHQWELIYSDNRVFLSKSY